MGFLSSKIKQQEEASMAIPAPNKSFPLKNFSYPKWSSEKPSSDSLSKEGYSPKRSFGRW
jgi:hypothetical protein